VQKGDAEGGRSYRTCLSNAHLPKGVEARGEVGSKLSIGWSFLKKRRGLVTNTNEIIVVTVIASPKGAAISSLFEIASSLRSLQ